jgi:hypothetical protein
MNMTDGILYIAWGEKATAGAQASIASLRQFSQLPALVVGGAGSDIVCKVDPFGTDGRFYAGRVKPLLYGLSPFDRTMYLDADTEFVAGPETAFALLDRWDVILTDTGHRSLADRVAGKEEAAATQKWFGTPDLLYHNSGVIFWRKNDAVKKLFALWAKEWKRFSGWDEQLALLRAVAKSSAMVMTAPRTWNTRPKEQAVLVYHEFGYGTAREA